MFVILGSVFSCKLRWELECEVLSYGVNQKISWEILSAVTLEYEFLMAGRRMIFRILSFSFHKCFLSDFGARCNL